MMVKGVAKQQFFRACDAMVPGTGACGEFLNRLYNLKSGIDGMQSRTVNERKRAALSLVVNAS